MTDQPELRDRYAKAIYEYANPGSQWQEAHPDDVHCYGSDAYAVLSVRDDELATTKALVEQAQAGLESSRRRAALFVERIDAARAWARQHLDAEQQAGLLAVLRGGQAEEAASSDAVIEKLKAEIVELQTHARISGALQRIDDAAVTRVIELAERWQHTPCRADALTELQAAILPKEGPDA